MSGKSTYIRSIALMTVMAQIGCFVPAQYASLPLIHQVFARVSMDDCVEANVSTFATEMREMAFILRYDYCSFKLLLLHEVMLTSTETLTVRAWPLLTSSDVEPALGMASQLH